jgi:hypothetical protein
VNDTQIYASLFRGYRTWVGWATHEMEQAAVDWRPDPQANNIALTIWHMARALDVLIHRIFSDGGPRQELWSTRGWEEKYEYNPAGKGWSELGNLAGYGPEEIAEMPGFALSDLLQYFDQCLDSVYQFLESVSTDELDDPAPFWPDGERTFRQVMEMFLMDGLAHMGEIRAIRAMWERKHE